jgi:N-acyl-D-aspartate/D-glutamate deacylase
MHPDWQVLIRGARVFDGTGGPSAVEDIAIARGKIAARGPGLPLDRAEQVVDAAGRWLLPGLLDIHTHLDLEVELAPGLPESVRHGTTTVVVGNCSLGTAFGTQRRNGDDPILDCFTRVENMPKPVLRRVVDRIDWHTTGGYLSHLDQLPLGPNIVPLLPHSMLRIEAMGSTDAAVTREPTAAERERMRTLLGEAMAQGYAGLSTDSIPFHYLANDPHRSARIPAQHAAWSELKELLDVVRRHDRVWQCTPDAANRAKTFFRFFLTSGRLFGKPLRTSALTAVDLTHERNTHKLFPIIANLLNSRLVNGRFHFQVLGTPFRMFAEGAICPIFEEFESSRRLMALEIEDAMAGGAKWIRRTSVRCSCGNGTTRAQSRRSIAISMRFTSNAYRSRNGAVRHSGRCIGAVAVPDRIARRAQHHGIRRIDAFPSPLRREGEFLLHLFRRYDRDLRWWFTIANDRPEILRDLLFHPHMLPGFNDSGAHLINLAFFDGNLLTLQIAARESLEMVAKAVRRLTREPAEFFGVDAGRLDVGAQADVVLLDPEALRHYDTDANRRMIYRDIFEHEQLVNRSDGVVAAVFIAGEQVWDGTDFTPALGSRRLGRALRAG